jgi:hypothetical protein
MKKKIPLIVPGDRCNLCGIKLEGWLYYQKADFKICHFCYNMLELKGEDR